MRNASFVGERGGLQRHPMAPAGHSLPVLSIPDQGPVRPGAGDAFVAERAAYKKLRWSLSFAAFLAYVGIITTYRLNIADVAVVAALAGLAFQRPIRIPWLIWLFAGFTAWAAFSYFQSAYQDAVASELSVLWKLGLILLAAVNAVRSRSQLRTFIVFWLGCFALYPVRGTYLNYFVAHYTLFGRAIWNFVFSNPNDLGAVALLQLSLVVGLLVTERKGWVRTASLIGAPVLTLLVFMTQSRGVLIGLSVAALVGVASQLKRIRLRMVLFALATGIVVLMAAPAGVWNRLGALKNATSTETLAAADQEGSAEQRYRIWQTALKIISDNAVFGVGLGAYPDANAAYSPQDNSAGLKLGARDTHSTYFNVAAELGAPGLMFFLLLIVYSVVHAERARRACARSMPKASIQLFCLELGLLGFLVAGIWASYARLSFLYLHLALMYAMAEACKDDLRALQRRPVSAVSAVP